MIEECVGWTIAEITTALYPACRPAEAKASRCFDIRKGRMTAAPARAGCAQGISVVPHIPREADRRPNAAAQQVFLTCWTMRARRPAGATSTHLTRPPRASLPCRARRRPRHPRNRRAISIRSYHPAAGEGTGLGVSVAQNRRFPGGTLRVESAVGPGRSSSSSYPSARRPRGGPRVDATGSRQERCMSMRLTPGRALCRYSPSGTRAGGQRCRRARRPNYRGGANETLSPTGTARPRPVRG